jgi:hypothetical protein
MRKNIVLEYISLDGVIQGSRHHMAADSFGKRWATTRDATG